MTTFRHLMTGLATAALLASGAIAEELTIVHGSIGRDQENLRDQLDRFEAEGIGVSMQPNMYASPFLSYMLLNN